jgi:hypothetical protein
MALMTRASRLAQRCEVALIGPIDLLARPLAALQSAMRLFLFCLCSSWGSPFSQNWTHPGDVLSTLV